MLLESYWWGSVFLITLPLIAVAVPLALRLIPSHVNEETEPVDNLGGILSAVLVGALILLINFAAVPDSTTKLISFGIITVAGVVAFALRERRVPNPLYDLHVARRRVFWVAACAGIIVFGSLMGAMFIGQQFLQDVLSYSTVDAGLPILPAVFFMLLAAPRSAKLVESHGARFTLLLGYAFVMAGFLVALGLLTEGVGYWAVGLGYALVGAGVGFAGTPASHSLTGSVPVRRVGMASGTADLQRDLGGAILQSIMGALLTAGYASAAAATIAGSPQSSQVSASVQSELTKSFSGAQRITEMYPQYSKSIIAAAKESFVHGQHWAYAAGALAVAAGAVLVWLLFPKGSEEKRLLTEYLKLDAGRADPAPAR